MRLRTPQVNSWVQRRRDAGDAARGVRADDTPGTWLAGANVVRQQRAPLPEAPPGSGVPTSSRATPEAHTRPAAQGRFAPQEAPVPSRVIAISCRVVELVGDTAAALIACQMIYWTRRGNELADRDGWIFKTAADWEAETGLTWKVQRRARQHLVNLGWLQERKLTMPARLEFRLRLGSIGPLLLASLDTSLPANALDSLSDWRSGTELAGAVLGRGFAFHRSLAERFSLHTAMLCSRLISGQRLTERSSATPPRFVSLSRQGWANECGLSRDQWQTARRNLRDAGVLIERQGNFPRRVDLAVDMGQLLLALQAGARPTIRTGGNANRPGSAPYSSINAYRRDRAIQVGGIGHLPIPPGQSPNPTFRNLPIPPSSTAQSSLYLLQLQEIPQLQPQLQPHAAHPGTGVGVPAFAPFGWGGGGSWAGPARQETAKQPAGQSKTPLAGSGETASGPGLHWPKVFVPADLPQAMAHLNGLPADASQALLDEIEWRSRSDRSVRSPIGLLRVLVRQHRQGQFQPDGAHRIEAERQAQRQRAEAAAAQALQAGSGDSAPQRSVMSAAVRQKVNELLGKTGRAA